VIGQVRSQKHGRNRKRGDHAGFVSRSILLFDEVKTTPDENSGGGVQGSVKGWQIGNA
jgi:hypothetical protein